MLSVTHNGYVCIVGAVDSGVTSGGGGCEACCISVGVVDLALDGEVLNFAGEVSKYGVGYGKGLAVTVEDTPEGLCIGCRKGDVCCKVVLCSRLGCIGSGGNHCQEFVCGVDRGSFGSSICGNCKYASREKHHNAEKDGECLSHCVYLFLFYTVIRYELVLLYNILVEKSI